MIELYPSQQESVEHLTQVLAEHPAALDASDTGTGKTYVACEVARRLNAPLLVVCPKSVVSSWRRVASDIECAVLDVVSYELLRYGSTPWLVKHNSRQFEWVASDDTLVVFDEAHRCSGYRSQLSSICALTRAFGYRTLLLSATIADNPLKLRAAGYLLGLHRWVDHVSWCKKHGCRKGYFGGLEPPAAGKLPEIMERIGERIFPEKGVRIRSSEMPEFPETLITSDAYDIPEPEQLDVICHQLQDLIADAATRTTKEGGSITMQLRLRQQAEYLKLPVFRELARDALEQGSSVVLFTAFRQTLDALAADFPDAEILHGGVSGADRRTAIQRFQDNRVRVFLSTIGAGGTGLSLHDLDGGHPRVAIMSPTFNAQEMHQLFGRVHRAGGKSKSIQKLVYAAGTIEEKVAERLQHKLRAMQALNDADLMYVE